MSVKAFAEWLWCPAFIVRSGEDCDHYGAPFAFAVVVAVPWRSFFFWLLGFRASVVVKALVAPGEKSLAQEQAHYRAGRALLESKRFEPTWDRIK